MKIPVDQNTDRSDKPDLTVEHVMPIELFGVQYVEKGRVKQGLFCYSGGTLYQAPDGAEWLGKLRPLSDRLAANVKAAFDRTTGVAPEDVPLKDTVDVVASSVVDEHGEPPLTQGTDLGGGY